ncbi:hypothetical protein [Galbibacter sp.]|uniref:hypothetical protein n=1 Tax=Galbibacter sp. TaxID=2918471 RepID=UPI003A91CF7D
MAHKGLNTQFYRQNAFLYYGKFISKNTIKNNGITTLYCFADNDHFRGTIGIQ